MSNWCLGCFAVVPNGDYCPACQPPEKQTPAEERHDMVRYLLYLEYKEGNGEALTEQELQDRQTIAPVTEQERQTIRAAITQPTNEPIPF